MSVGDDLTDNVKTAAVEDIVLDEDDGFAVLTRRLLDEHEFLKDDGRVKVITKAGAEGTLKMAGNSLSKTEPKALTTLPVLYDVLRYLGWDLPGVVREMNARPNSEVLEASYGVHKVRIDDLLTTCGGIRERLLASAGARELRAPKNNEGDGHPFMRPVIQKAVARVSGEIVYQGLLTWPEVMARLAKLDWRLAARAVDRGVQHRERQDDLGQGVRQPAVRVAPRPPRAEEPPVHQAGPEDLQGVARAGLPGHRRRVGEATAGRRGAGPTGTLGPGRGRTRRDPARRGRVTAAGRFGDRVRPADRVASSPRRVVRGPRHGQRSAAALRRVVARLVELFEVVVGQLLRLGATLRLVVRFVVVVVVVVVPVVAS